jgi:hypothetical protein
VTQWHKKRTKKGTNVYSFAVNVRQTAMNHPQLIALTQTAHCTPPVRNQDRFQTIKSAWQSTGLILTPNVCLSAQTSVYTNYTPNASRPTPHPLFLQGFLGVNFQSGHRGQQPKLPRDVNYQGILDCWMIAICRHCPKY